MTTIKKIGLVVFLAIFSTVSARAMVNIKWWSSNGITDMTAGDLVMLIYSPSNSLSAINPSSPTSVAAWEAVLDSQGGINGGFDLGPVDFGTGNQYEGGYAFVRAFSTATPTIGDYYMESTLAMLSSYPLPNSTTPVQIDLAPSAKSFATDGTMLVIPEPGTLAFGLIGLGVVVARRFRKA